MRTSAAAPSGRGTGKYSLTSTPSPEFSTAPTGRYPPVKSPRLIRRVCSPQTGSALSEA